MNLYQFAINVNDKILVADSQKRPIEGDKLLLHTRKGKALLIVREVKEKKFHDEYYGDISIYTCEEIVSVIGHRQRIISDGRDNKIISVFA